MPASMMLLESRLSTTPRRTASVACDPIDRRAMRRRGFQPLFEDGRGKSNRVDGVLQIMRDVSEELITIAQRLLDGLERMKASDGTCSERCERFEDGDSFERERHARHGSPSRLRAEALRAVR